VKLHLHSLCGSLAAFIFFRHAPLLRQLKVLYCGLAFGSHSFTQSSVFSPGIFVHLCNLDPEVGCSLKFWLFKNKINCIQHDLSNLNLLDFFEQIASRCNFFLVRCHSLSPCFTVFHQVVMKGVQSCLALKQMNSEAWLPNELVIENWVMFTCSSSISRRSCATLSILSVSTCLNQLWMPPFTLHQISFKCLLLLGTGTRKIMKSKSLIRLNRRVLPLQNRRNGSALWAYTFGDSP